MEAFKGLVNFISYDPEYHEYNIEIEGVKGRCDPFIGHGERSKKLKGMKHIVGRWDVSGDERCLLVNSLEDVKEPKEVVLSESRFPLSPSEQALFFYRRYLCIRYVSHFQAKKLATLSAEDCLHAFGIEKTKSEEYKYWKTVIKTIKLL
jgi:hypothetical protein